MQSVINPSLFFFKVAVSDSGQLWGYVEQEWAWYSAIWMVFVGSEVSGQNAFWQKAYGCQKKINYLPLKVVQALFS